ncbi:penicillin-binding protein 1C [Flavobacteriaceae bacterium 14752]|nr:penicillin-binding protein 1C [Flavobacteriaceae bacterium 14752]
MVVLLSLWYLALPQPLFKAPLSTVVWSKENKLLGARVAQDGQWRFPASNRVPEKFKQSILYFEDEYFKYHPGFNPISMVKAFWHNLNHDSKRGGSTLTQQVIRLSRQNQSRTYTEKLIELFLATRIEVEFSKDDILNFYASYAPFGGNVVGLETAAWRYFNRPAKDLSWSQSAALAVLPNAPSLVFPGKNENILKAKRNRLLKKLVENKVIDTNTYQLALLEDLPGKAYDLPNITPHLTEWLRQNHQESQVKTNIDFKLQQQVNTLVEQHLTLWKSNQVYNAAVIIADIKTGQVLAYTGNSTSSESPFYYVDMIKSPRSTGSLLKPILYASMLDDGELLPEQLVKDTPARFDNYVPQNFTKDFQGAVHADVFIQKSLNVPAVRLLKSYGIDRFINKLQKLGLNHIDKSADHYGLPLILGGAESSLWELTSMYTHLAKTLKNAEHNQNTTPFENLKLIASQNPQKTDENNLTNILSPASIYLSFEAMSGLERPGLDAGWKAFANSRKIAWKTGTSYGFKDAWSIGMNQDYLVGVWVGNADGNGRPNLLGVNAAAPLMFSVFENMPSTKTWFAKPMADMKTLEVCAQTGYIKSLNCPIAKSIDIPKTQLKLKPCPFHKIVNLNADKTYQVRSSCQDLPNKITSSWFVLPPIMAYYYKKNHPEYQDLPPLHPKCQSSNASQFALIYPKANQDIILPKTFDETVSEVIFKAAYDENKTLYWHIDDEFMGTTQYFHDMQFQPEAGEHILTLVNEDGQQLQRRFRLSYTETH